MERAEGTLLLAFVDFEILDERTVKRCAQILSSKLKRGQRVYCIEFRKTISQDVCWDSCAGSRLIHAFMSEQTDNTVMFTILYRSYLYNDNTGRSHRLLIKRNTRNSVANTKELIDMINGDSLMEAKQYLGSMLTLIEAAEGNEAESDTMCGNCGSGLILTDDERIILVLEEPSWSNCVGCELK